MSPVEWMTCTASAQMHSPFSSVSLLINSIWQSIGQLCVCGYQSNQYDRTHSFSLLQMRERVHLRMSTKLRVLELANAANWLEVIGSSGKLVSFSASMISRFLSLSPQSTLIYKAIKVADSAALFSIPFFSHSVHHPSIFNHRKEKVLGQHLHHLHHQRTAGREETTAIKLISSRLRRTTG